MDWWGIEAADVLFFRDSLPFDAGDAAWAKGTWPPGIAPVQGALRTLLIEPALAKIGAAFTDLDRNNPSPGVQQVVKRYGDAETLGALSFAGPWLRVGEADFWLPRPGDLRTVQDKVDGKLGTPREERASLSAPASGSDWSRPPAGTNLLPLLAPGVKLSGSEPSRWISAEDLQLWMRGGAPAAPAFPPEAPFEVRVGLARDEETRLARSGHLYAKRVARPDHRPHQEVTLLVGSLGMNDDDRRLVAGAVTRLGGDGHFARLTAASGPGAVIAGGDPKLEGEIAALIDARKRFRVALLTPGVFENGWLPCPCSGELDVGGKRLGVLRGAFVGKPAPLGGWDRKRGCPKPMRRAVPAGAVYCFQLAERAVGADVVPALHGKPLACSLPAPAGRYYEQLGHGWAVVGAEPE